MRVLITGAARGLGIELVKKYLAEDHEIIACVRSLSHCEELMELSRENERIVLCEMDVTSWTSIDRCFSVVKEKFDYIDVVINNAGVLYASDKKKTLCDVDVDVLRSTMQVNVEGPVLVLKGVYPLLEKSSNPFFFVITSESSIESSWSGMPVYSLSKVAANKVVSIIRATIGEKCNVLAIHPGRMNTDMGKETAQIETDEAAQGIYALSIGLENAESWYVDYKGKAMKA